MAKYAGRGGALLLGTSPTGAGTSIVNLTSWSISIDTDQAEVTSLGDSWKSYVTGVKSASASMSGFWADDAQLPFVAFDQTQTGGKVAIALYPAGTGVAKFFTGTIWPKSVGVDDSVGGAVTFKMDGVFDGAVSRT